MDSLMLDSEGGPRRSIESLKYIASGNEPSISVSDNDLCKSTENFIMVRGPSKRTFSHVIKAVLFETVLAKRVRDRKSISQSQDSYPPKRSFPRRRSLDSSVDDDKSLKRVSSVDHTDIREIKSIRSILSSPSSVRSSSSVCSTISFSESKRHNQERVVVKPTEKSLMGCNSSSFNCCISLLLMSLAVTILWGRICAILFTSIWLYFTPQQRTCRPENLKRSVSKKEYRVYKKRIIMEGLLERNHHKESALNF
ncbi:Transmembrane protein [Melia azedarach]|uniref:Transmembrane protein n=1 Tax=Melia azedarach TaxID=155640 RepID=A0ACC1Z1K2_MELAZ|nr:Transmembrane protein [Melia azedarach]